MGQLGLGDTDNDGLDDQWEITYFGDLSRDGTGDFDQDGVTDLQEHLAGTNPTDDTSLLAVLVITQVADGSKTIFWSAVPGKVYHLEHKEQLSGDWTPLSPPLAAAHSTESYVDPSPAAPSRYYRVRLLR